ncbi:hypothetical protein [Mucilaginibacter sp. UYCu711]|uniref:hypothetical protein n=1 Tax=Mucilaginibacter sp. UYCu711 TaxID=3156339 RepID=UPI003D21A259
MKTFKPTSLIPLIVLLIFTGCKSSAIISKSKKSANLSVHLGARRGAIFTEKYSISKINASGFNPSKRFTPTRKEIDKIDRILYAQVIGYGKSKGNVYKPSPVLDRNSHTLRNYFSQYVGYITPDGEKVIHTNFVWNENKLIGVDNDYVAEADTENLNWQVDINLTTQKVIDVRINNLNR